jgi:SAM-dependent methyltransferase
MELGIFEALGRSAASAEKIASVCNADARGIRILLDALTATDVVEHSPHGYRIRPPLADCLLEAEPGYTGNLLLHDLWHWTSWARLDEVVREGKALERRDGDPHLTNPEILHRFLPNYVAAMEQCIGDSPERIAALLAPLGPRSILDLGGGTGAHLMALLEELPDARGVLAELAFSLEQARGRVHDRGLDARIELIALDFDREPIPSGHDLILISRVLMGLGPDRARDLIRRCAEAVAPGGHLAIHDYAPRSRVGALLSLDMLLNTGGEVHSASSVAGWLESAGLTDISCEHVLPYTRLYVARKPAEGTAT